MANREEKNRAEVLSLGDLAKILVAIPLERAAVYLSGALFGARYGELAGLSWGDLFSTEGLLDGVTIARQWTGKIWKATKTKAIHTIPIRPDHWAILEALRVKQQLQLGRWTTPADPMFAFFARGEQRRWSENTLLRNFRKDYRAAGVEDPFVMDVVDGELRKTTFARRVHALRHTFISQLLNADAPERVVRSMTHKKPSGDSFGRYAHVSWASKCAAVSMLPARFAL